MRADEFRDSAEVGGTALAEIADLVNEVHGAVSTRLFDLVGPVGAPARALHDAVSAVAFGSTRLGLRTIPAVGGIVAAALRRPSADSVADTVRGHFALGALNGWMGDRLAAEGRSLAADMTLRTRTGRLRCTAENVVHDLGGEVSGRIVVFAHGLCGNDRAWGMGAEKNFGDHRVTYGSLLREEDGWTPLYLNYNSGLHISDNGHRLAESLESVVAYWPVPVTEIALVGHSMGGLVVRSAAHQAAADELSWVRALRHIVGLGTPHLGAPLERFTNARMHALARLPETRPFATYLNRRSAGIKDLRYGSVVEQDWSGFDPDERLTDRCTPPSLLPDVAYSMAAATLSREPNGLLAHDLFVHHLSAHGAGSNRRMGFAQDRLFHLGGRHHFHLLSDPLVYRQLRSWLAGADGATPPNRDAV